MDSRSEVLLKTKDPADLQAVCTGRRRTCALLNSPSPYVNTVMCHVQEFKMTVEKWFQQSGRYQPQIDRDKHQHGKTLGFQSRDSDTESVMSTELFVEGIAITAKEGCPLAPPLLKKINDVLGEVVYLTERLEADRQYAEEAINKEKRRKRFLEDKVDSISLWKQQEHSFIVQKEHEACTRDIAELKWQLKQKREKLVQAQEKLSHTELLNQRLQEDISFAKKQVPIVKENMEVQRGIINEINIAQAEADEVRSKLQSELMQVKKELKKMQLEAKYEKRSMDHKLSSMENQLANKLKELESLKMVENGLNAEIADAKTVVASTEDRCAAIAQRSSDMMELEKAEKDRIVELKCQIEEKMLRNKKLKDKLISRQEHIEKTRLSGEAEVSRIEEQLRSKRNALSALHKKNLGFEQDIEDYKRKLTESERAVRQMHEERKQMLQKIIDNDGQWEKAKEEMTQVEAQHSVTLTELQEQEQLTFMEEQKARKHIENLREDLIGQMATRELLKAQCAHLNEELSRHQRNSALTNQKLQKNFEDASTAKKTLETKIKKLRELVENSERSECEHKNTLIRLDKERKLRRDQLKAAQDTHTATLKRYDNTLNRISDLTKKCEQYQDVSVKMESTAESLQEDIEELQSVFDVVEFKNKSAALIMSNLQSAINNCQQRTQRFMQTHSAHVTARKEVMDDKKEALKIALKENQQLASEYEELQRILIEAKKKAASALAEKNHEHETFHDYIQLSLLQKRMHKDMVEYFKQRSLYSQAELDRCQALSQETDQKIKTAQEKVLENIQLIYAFLQSLTDDSTTTNDGGMNKQACPDAAGWNE
ncbi:coiled-coil domain-containing protein 178 isoform X2 [Halichoeres trimaculatus]|uniref:coiled-coil domain-containing protein 178 isoform X2 n=1 Tax=Halichoeres trimaculatus TaxID=147232 RepID=UPI003D9E27AF